MYLLSNWLDLSEKGLEDAIYDSYEFRKFTRADFMGEKQLSDAGTLCKFRRLLGDNVLTKPLFDAIKGFPDRR